MSTPGYYPPAADQLSQPTPPPANPWGPFTAGELLRRTFALYREHPALFLSISLLAAAASFVIQSPNQIITYAFRSHPPAGLAEIFSRALLQLALALIILAASSVLYAVTHGVFYAMVVSLRRGTVPTLTSAMEAITPRLARLAFGYILVILRLIGWGMLVAVPFTIIFALAVTLIAGIGVGVHGSGPSTAAAGIIGLMVIVLVLLFLPFFFWLYLRYSLFVPVMLEENLGANASIRRSIELTRHAKARLAALYGFVLLLCIPAFVLGGVGGYFATKHHTANALMFELAALLIGSLYGAFLITPVYGIGIALCYFDLRARKDAAPIAPPPLPTPAWEPPPAIIEHHPIAEPEPPSVIDSAPPPEPPLGSEPHA